MTKILPGNLYPQGANVILVSNPENPLNQDLVKAFLSPNQIWAHNLSNCSSFFSMGSAVVLFVSMLGMGVTHKHDKTKNYAHRFFRALACVGAVGFLGSFVVVAYSAYQFNKI